MCQLNVMVITKKAPQSVILKEMRDFGMGGDCVTKEFQQNEISEEYNFFIYPSYWCHCYSFITKFCDEKYSDYSVVESLRNHRNIEEVTFEEEYCRLHRWISHVVSKYGGMKFFSFWQDGKNPHLEKERNVGINELSFYIFARLNYLELINITP